MLLEAVSACHYSAGLQGVAISQGQHGGSSQGMSHLQPPSAWGERGCLGWQGWEGALLELPGLQMWFYVLVNATLLQRACLDPKAMLKPITAQKGEKAETGKQQMQCQLCLPRVGIWLGVMVACLFLEPCLLLSSDILVEGSWFGVCGQHAAARGRNSS